MNARKNYRPGWDSAFFMERATPEWRPAPRRESEPIRFAEPEPFNFERVRRAWADIGVIANEKWIREHMAMLKKWQERRR
jgi:hypothetical protein